MKEDQNSFSALKKTYGSIPGVWNKYEYRNLKLPGSGYATYRAQIKLPDKELYFLKILNMSSAYNLYIDDKLIASNGIVGKSKEEYSPEYMPQIVYFSSENEWTDIILEVANFDHFKGGFWEPIILGDLDSITDYSFKKELIEVFLLGFLITTALIYINLRIFLKKENTFVFLSLFLLILSIRILTIGERNINVLFPEIGWEALLKLEYLSYYLAITIFLLFLMNFLKKFKENIYLKLSIVFYLINSLVVILSEPVIFTHVLNYVNIYTLILGFYIFYSLLVSKIQKEPSSKEFMIAFMILFGIVLIEIIAVQLGKSLNQTSILGVLLFVVSILFEVNRKFSKDVEKTKRSNEELEDMANRDGLTGLFNHRYMCESLNKLCKEKDQRTHHSLGLFDLDDFKMVNDIYGHQSGDFVLKEVAKIMKENTRSEDILGRYGGEECMIIFKNTELESAFMVSDRLREKMDDLMVERMGLRVTISGGLIEIGEEDPSQAVERVDKLLYKAKKSGKNRIEKE